MPCIAVVTTVASRDQAEAMARALVERQLAACVQIEAIDSFYTWEGQLQQDAEFRVLAKTVAERYGAVEAAMRELHSYDLPGIYAYAMAPVYPPFAAWIASHSCGR